MSRLLMIAVVALTLSACSGGDSSNADATSGGDSTVDTISGDKDASVQKDSLGSCNVAGYQSVGLTELATDLKSYDGKKIVVCAKGTLSIGCTGAACPPEDPCCGSCAGGLQLGSRIALKPADGSAPYSCSGNGCMHGMTCSPWPQDEMEAERCHFGTFKESPGGFSGELLVDQALDSCTP